MNSQKFFNFPLFIEYNNYVDIKHKFANELSEIKGISNIYSCGNIDTPGISDLDFLLTVDSSCFEEHKLFELYNNFSTNEQYTIGCHYPFLAPLGWDSKFHYLLPLSNPAKWDGKNFQPFTQPNLSRVHMIPILCELCSVLYPRIFMMPLFTQRFDVRKIVMSLKAFLFPIKYIREITNDQQFAYDFQQKVIYLKDQYFALDRKEVKNLLVNLLKQASKLSYRIPFILHEYLTNYIQIPNRIKESDGMYSIGLSNIIYSNIDYGKATRRTKALLQYTRKLFTFIPQTLAIYSYEYLSKNPSSISSLNENRYKLIQDYAKFITQPTMKQYLVWPPYLALKNSAYRSFSGKILARTVNFFH